MKAWYYKQMSYDCLWDNTPLETKWRIRSLTTLNNEKNTDHIRFKPVKVGNGLDVYSTSPN